MKVAYSMVDAAVLLVLLREQGEDKILLTRRSDHLREHSGEIALPGGKREQGDTSLYRTALRECFEEVGIPEYQLAYRSELEVHHTRKGARVTPFVVELSRESPPLDLALCKNEIASSRWVPLSLFIQDQRSFTHIFKLKKGELWAPVYHFHDYEIWGLTARVMVSFVNKFYGGQISRGHSHAQERVF